MKGRPKRKDLPYEKQRFYVFYDAKDNVRYCGTADQLIEEGFYSSISSFHASVTHIRKSKKQLGKVYVLK